MALKITPLSSCLGATVEGLGVDPSGIDATTTAELRQALLDHKVIFFPRINLTNEQHVALGSAFGELAATSPDQEGDNRAIERVEGWDQILVIDSARYRPPTDVWHTDVTWADQPPLGSLLSAKIIPPRGGDTLWADTAAAYGALPDPLKRAIDGEHAVHGRPPATKTAVHPMVKPHAETGEPCLFVNRGWTKSIEGMAPHVGSPLLGILFDFMERPEFTTRWSWSDGDAALWDNRCTMHHAPFDYDGQRRRIHRVTIFA